MVRFIAWFMVGSTLVSLILSFFDEISRRQFVVTSAIAFVLALILALREEEDHLDAVD